MDIKDRLIVMNVFAEKFDDIKILRFEVNGFEKLPLKKKLYIYYLSQATIAGRDILWDQHGKYNLMLRDVLEAIFCEVSDLNNPEWQDFVVYLKKMWFSSGIHHHYSTDKFTPSFSEESFKNWFAKLKPGMGNVLPVHLTAENEAIINKLLFDPNFMKKRVNSNGNDDVIITSCNNFYEEVTQQQVEDFYEELKKQSDNKKLSFGLNSKLLNSGENIEELVYKSGGLYGGAIDKIIENLKEAIKYAENEFQVELLILLVKFYSTGDLSLFDDFSIKWVSELNGSIDFINGFIETYGDPMGMKATWEGLVQLVDEEETKKAETIAENANWFEDHAPVDKQFKKDEIKGISLKGINAVMLGGDCYPASPLGINLPNAEWIREEYGSKSVTLTNISNAHHKASLSTGFVEEFTFDSNDVALEKRYGSVADNLHTHLHECIGHGSGKMLPGVTSDSLKSYGSVIEEARADLYGLYFMYDEKMLELNLLPDLDAAKAHYNSYIRNGLLTQITRIKLGNDIEQAHMRNRQLICKWVYEKGKGEVIEKVKNEGKTFFVIKDYQKLRALFGDLLAEIQRIKSTGDYKAAMEIVETYGVKIEKELHEEVLARFKKLEVPPFTGFLNPNMQLVKENHEVTDVVLDYNTNYSEQMLSYSMNYNYLKAF